MYLIRQGSRVCISTPAKLNLFLELHHRRRDGFHDLETIMLPINIYDSLCIQPSNDAQIRLSCKWVDGMPAHQQAEMPTPENNIVTRTLALLKQQSGIDQGAEVSLVKRIPAQAGLGGGSSDAAAALLAANQVWNLHWPTERLAKLAAEMGSDVPFFLFNSLARCTGRGELIEPMSSATRLSCVVVKPDFGLSTPDVFAHVEVPQRPTSSETLLQGLMNGDPRKIGSCLFNRLQSAASKLTPWIARIARQFESLSVWGHQLSGSGTSYFGICRNRRHARQVASRLRATQSGRVFVATTLGPAAAY